MSEHATTADLSTKHPAKFSEPILGVLERAVAAEWRRQRRRLLLVDPFAGVGRCHLLAITGKVMTLGVEIEPEWARCHQRTVCANSLEWMSAQAMADDPRVADIVATSPCYGNRFADHHNATDGSRRRSYKHDLGRMPTTGSAAVLHWGPAYWRFHADAYRGIFELLRPGGLFLLNVSDFYRNREQVHATPWHHGAASAAGFEPDGRYWCTQVPTDRQRDGANHELRADHEIVFRFRKPGGDL